jgi:hypothetical protein
MMLWYRHLSASYSERLPVLSALQKIIQQVRQSMRASVMLAYWKNGAVAAPAGCEPPDGAPSVFDVPRWAVPPIWVAEVAD